MKYSERLLRIVDEYRASDQAWPATSAQMARWAISQNLWAIHPAAVVRQCAGQLAQAMREEYIKDPRGKKGPS